MAMEMTTETYCKLVCGDMEWLRQQPRSLERDHIAAILNVEINTPRRELEGERDALKKAFVDRDAVCKKAEADSVVNYNRWGNALRDVDAKDKRIAELEARLAETSRLRKLEEATYGLQRVTIAKAKERIAELEAERDADEVRIYLYNSGYLAGHHHTVEGGYVDIHRGDMTVYHADEVREILEDLSPAPATPEKPSEPWKYRGRCWHGNMVHLCEDCQWDAQQDARADLIEKEQGDE